jgi:hypothetical protein
MARDESSREDLLREATALVERIEFVRRDSRSGSPDEESERERIVAGFRSNGAFSVFFGDDQVYQFNAAGELRRAFFGGRLLKASVGHLVSIRRVRTANEVQLLTHPLSESEEAAFLSQMSDHLNRFSQGLGKDSFEIAGQVPPDSAVLARLRAWLVEHPNCQIALRPNA